MWAAQGEHFAFPGEGGGRVGGGAEGGEAALDEAIPAFVLQTVARVPAADHQAVFGAGEGDIEQAVVFLHALGGVFGALGAPGGAAHGFVGRPEWDAKRGGRVGGPDELGVVGGQSGGVGQDHDGRLEALGAVHGHDPHGRAGRPGLALDLGAGAAEPVDEALQRGRVIAGVVEGGTEQFVERFGGFGAEAGQEAGATAEGAQEFGEQGRGGVTWSARGGERGEEGAGGFPLETLGGAVAQRAPEGAGALGGEIEQALLSEAAEGAGEDAADGEVVGGQQDGVAGGEDVLDGGLLGEDEAVEAGDGDAAGFEGADQVAGKVGAATDEDENVARVEGAVAAFEALAGG